MGTWSIRRYAGTLAEVRGLRAVERKTFRECPYPAHELLRRLAAPEQRVWLAEAAGQVVGFVAGIHTWPLRGACIEADLLAVDPDWQGQGIATALLLTLRRDASHGQALRGVVSVHNPASERAFWRAGFRPAGETHDLFLCRLRGRARRTPPRWGGVVRPLQTFQEAALFVSLAPGASLPAERVWANCRAGRVTLLGAWLDGTLAAGVELLEVHTLLYSGLWLESVLGQGEQAHAALIAATIELAKERQLDEVGCLVSQVQRPLRARLLAAGLTPLDSYRIWMAAPLPWESRQA